MIAEIRGTDAFAACLDAVLSSDREELLIGFGNTSIDEDWLMLITDSRLGNDAEVTRDVHGLHWSGELTAAIHSEARRSGRGIVLLHAHGGHGHTPRPSPTDVGTAEEILPHFGLLLPDVPHAYVVINKTHVAGWMQVNEEQRALSGLRAMTNPLRVWPSQQNAGGDVVLGRDDRQATALGRKGIARLRRSTVGIVGLGGAGSQVAEMLAHAGVGHMMMADADDVEDINLSRTHGTSPDLIGQAKVSIARSMVERISPETRVTAMEEAFPTARLLRELKRVDVLVSCVDTVHARNEVNRFALRYGIPLIDVGTTIAPDPFRVDGHLTLVIPGSACLRCAGHVSDAIVADEGGAARERRYGINEKRPQVVSFNGLLASAAVTEVLKLITGFGGAIAGSREWHYDPVANELRPVGLASTRCRECNWYAMVGDQAQG